MKKRKSFGQHFLIRDDIAEDIVNSLIMEYDLYTKDVKNIRAINTSSFIDSRIELIASDLVNVDDSIVRFKTGNKLTNVSSEADQFVTSSTQNEQMLDESKTQLRVLNYPIRSNCLQLFYYFSCH